MTEANLAATRKVVLYVGLLVAALLFLFPHWRVTVGILAGAQALEQDIGRGFIANPPSTTGLMVARINYVRQIAEVAIALLFTFGLTLALMKAAGGRKHNAEE